MLYYILFWMFNGLYYTLLYYFGTNLLTGGPAQNPVFCLFQCFAEKEYQTESKRNETFGNVIFGTNVIQRTWSLRQESNEESTRQGARLPPSRRALHPRGAHVAPLTYFFLLYIPMYPGNIIYGAKTLFPPLQPFVPVRSHLGAFSGAPPEGGIDHGGLLHQHHSLSDDV